MSTAIAARVFVPAPGVWSGIEAQMRAALSPAEVGLWQAMHNQVRPIDAARRITSGRPGAQIYMD